MMLPTHLLVGLAVATPLVALSPELAGAALIGGALGSVLPDFDLYADHRRALHYPTGYALAAVPAGLWAVLVQTPLAVGLALSVVGAALHCHMDRYGGGLELRPWEARSERAVYDHYRGAWRAPKRWIRYDGAPEDVLVAVALGVPLIVVTPQPVRWLVTAALVVGVGYGLLRRRIVDLAPLVVDAVPAPVEPHVPERYRD
jgi:hypothetical protein